MKVIRFEFTSYSFEPHKKRVVFKYTTEFKGAKNLVWTEVIHLPKPITKGIPKELLKKILESLHIILGISYYKFYPVSLNKRVPIKVPYRLSKKEAEFWNVVYKKGLGEFFYKNKLDPKISPQFTYDKNYHPKPVSYTLKDRSLVGIGGGKDSIVAAELLKQQGLNFSGFSVESITSHKKTNSQTVKRVIEMIGVGDLKITRVLDEKVHLNHDYNGHIPISAVYAFLGVLACVLYDVKFFIVGNEHSSNFGNTTYKGQTINHQWSKSFEFETLFQDYVKNSITPDVQYFSLLRPFHEIRIVKLFLQYKKYLPYFSSCNRNFTLTEKTHRGLWCNQCAKCVFMFTLFSAFLSKKAVIKLFGKNLYQEKELLSLFKDILGLGTMKPFDCVGTFEEAMTALYLAKKKFSGDFIVRHLAPKAKYYPEVLKVHALTAVPEQFKFLGAESALILGYGKEGKITKKYLKKYYPYIKIGITDSKEGKHYLQKQKNFDIAIKTPGIQKELMSIAYTTATNIFFGKVAGKNLTIGVTGSKGKSTTSSLVYHILKSAGKDVEFLGNIGKPMLESLLKPVAKNRIFVLELSSYQLDDIAFSPDIAVVTNLFPEHMDFHGGLKNYYNAKKNIIRFQTKKDYFIYNSHNKEMKDWLKGYQGKAVPFFKNTFGTHLLGEHNQSNIAAAVRVARILHIPDTVITKAIKTFKGLPHRLEFIGEFKGIQFYDDGSSTNPESAINAIVSLKHVDTIFLGGQDRGYDFSELEKTIKKYHIKNLVLFPETGEKMVTSKKEFNILKTSDMKKAVEFAYKHTKKGGICLLSGASPSYSLWSGFSEKGDEFKKLVRHLR